VRLWQRMVTSPENLETLWLLDVAWNLKNIAWRDRELRALLQPAFEWALQHRKTPKALPGRKGTG
jgi:hypothetical protein